MSTTMPFPTKMGHKRIGVSAERAAFSWTDSHDTEAELAFIAGLGLHHDYAERGRPHPGRLTLLKGYYAGISMRTAWPGMNASVIRATVRMLIEAEEHAE